MLQMDNMPRIVVWHDQAAAYSEALTERLPDAVVDAVVPGSPDAESLLEAAAVNQVESAAAPAMPAHPDSRVIRRAAEARALLAWKPPQGVLRSLPALEWIQVTGAGVDHFLDRADLPEDVLLTRSLGRFGTQVAEYVVGYLLHGLLDINGYREQQTRREWGRGERPLLADRTVGIMGLGSLGLPTARALAALGTRVVAATRSGNPQEGVDQVYGFDTWPEMLPQCDALVLAIPLTDQTEGLIDAAALAALPRGAVLINVARGALIDDAALLDALDRGHLGAAVLDVFSEEPLPADHPLWERSGAWITPHIAAPSELDAMINEFVANYERFVTGRTLINLVDRQRGY